MYFKRKNTCYGCLYVDHGLLLTKEGGTLIDDAQGSSFLDSSFQNEMLFENIWPGFTCFGVENFSYRELATGRKRYTYKKNRFQDGEINIEAAIRSN